MMSNEEHDAFLAAINQLQEFGADVSFNLKTYCVELYAINYPDQKEVAFNCSGFNFSYNMYRLYHLKEVEDLFS